MNQRRESPFDAAPDSFDLLELVAPILKRKWLVILVALVTCGAVAGWTVRQQPVYAATTTLEFDPDPPRPLGRQVEDVASPVSNWWSTQEFYATQNLILSSRALAERVVRALRLQDDDDFADQESDLSEDARIAQAAATLQGMILVERVEETRLASVRVSDTDPERAALLANTIADTYVEKGIEDRLGSTVTALEWLSEQLGTLKGQLETSERALYEFKKDHNVLSVSMEDRQNLLAGELSELNTELTDLRAQKLRLRSRLQTLKALDLTDPLLVQSSEIIGDPQVAAIRATYRAKLTELQRLATSYGQNHPTMEALQAEVAMLREQLEKMMQEIVGSTEAALQEVERIERDLQGTANRAHAAGIELSMQEIEYQRLQRARESQEKLYETVLERTAETDLTRMLKVSYARPVDRALVPSVPVSPRLKLNLIVGLLGGLLLGVLAAILVHVLDRSVKGTMDLEAMGLAVLGVLPHVQSDAAERGKAAKKGVRARGEGLMVYREPQSPMAECCRTVRTNLTFASGDEALRTLLITSASPQEGKTTAASSIAISLAQSGKRVLLVDTDLRRPQLHRAFDVSNAVGVTSVVAGSSSLQDAAQETAVPGLRVMPCGPVPPNPAELLHTARFEAFVKEAEAAFDMLVFDSPPLGAVTDAAILAPSMSGVMLVARSRRTARDALLGISRQLRGVNAHILGVVLNDVAPKERQFGSGYYYYYHQDYSVNAEEARGSAS